MFQFFSCMEKYSKPCSTAEIQSLLAFSNLFKGKLKANLKGLSKKNLEKRKIEYLVVEVVCVCVCVKPLTITVDTLKNGWDPFPKHKII